MVYWIHNTRLEQQFGFLPVFVDPDFNNLTFGIFMIHDWLQILKYLEVHNEYYFLDLLQVIDPFYYV